MRQIINRWGRIPVVNNLVLQPTLWSAAQLLLNNFNIMRRNYNPISSTLAQRPRRSPSKQPVSHPQTHPPTPSFNSKQFKHFLLPKENIMQAVSIVQWRCQTSLPIVRVAQYIVSPSGHYGCEKSMFMSDTHIKKPSNNGPVTNNTSQKVRDYVSRHPQVLEYELRVQAEDIKCRLNQIGIMPFSQALYLLKEMLIGFQALFDIFTSFQAKEELIGVNSTDQWCMWIDQDFCNNVKTQSSITEREFIYQLINITQKHSLQTLQSRNFFAGAKDSTFANDCSFLKMLERLKEFIRVNRIYIPSKASVGVQNSLNNSSSLRQKIFKKRKQSCQTFYGHNQPRQPVINLRSFPSCSDLRKDTLQGNNRSIGAIIPSSNQMNTSDQDNSFGWANKKLHTQHSSASLKFIHDNPSRERLNQNHRFSKTQNEIPAPLSRATSRQSLQSPIFYLARPRNIKRIQEGILPKPVSQANQPVKRANIRKYSQQLIKFKVFESNSKKFQSSSICNQLVEEHALQERWEEQQRKQLVLAPKNQAISPSQSSQGMVPSSPNNSSSTKEIGNSRQMEQDSTKPAYRSMKMKDLAPHRNNQSLINNHFTDHSLKNMSVSYQFKKVDDAQSDSQSQGRKKAPQQQWVNKISDLFSDTMSIKQLKGSIKFKTKQQQLFEKDYLKDVKLDMLEKFGRSVTINQQQSDHHNLKVVPKHNQYKSMQLIEEQLEEAKSYQQDERRDEEFTCKSIKSIRSRRQTQPQIDKDRQISFKDDFMICQSGQKGQGGFNFETEMYSMRVNRLI